MTWADVLNGAATVRDRPTLHAAAALPHQRKVGEQAPGLCPSRPRHLFARRAHDCCQGLQPLVVGPQLTFCFLIFSARRADEACVHVLAAEALA